MNLYNKQVGVVILNYNKSSYTIDCANSIIESDYNNIVLFIIDNGSKKEDYDKLCAFEHPKAKIVRIEDNCGYVGGVNRGILEAKSIGVDYFLVMNNDTIIDRKAINELVSASIDYNDNCIVSGKVYNMDNPNSLQYIGQWCKSESKLQYPPYILNSDEQDNGQYDKLIEMDMLDDVFWLFSMKVYQKVGLYSDYFFLYGEQNDYALRAKKNGVKLIYTFLAKIHHYHHLTTGGNERGLQRIYYWQSYAVLLLKYLHISKYRFLEAYFSTWLQLLFRGSGYLLLGKFSKLKRNYMPKLYAQIYFTKWMFFKESNTGFNPYN